MLGHGGPFRHRGLAHWWGLPVAAALGLAPLAPPEWRWAAWAAIAGWSSHLLGDFFFGRPAVMQGRGPGIPLMPWWMHIGIGLDTGGQLEKVTQRFLLPLMIGAELWLIVYR
jgi:hypothetical protein